MNAEDWFEKGNQLKRAGDLAGALDAFRMSIKLNARVAAPWIGLASVLEANSQDEDARECFRRAVLADPRHVDAHLYLATSHKNLGYLDDATKEYEQALRLNPKSSDAYFGLGEVFEDLGEPEQAAGAYRKAIAIDEPHSQALACLLGLGRYVDIAPDMQQASDILDTLDIDEKALVGYGLGKAYEHTKEYDKAFNAYSIANAARREDGGPFNRDAFDKRIKNIMELFSADFFAERSGYGVLDDTPVFIVGLPRSGTTLTEQIIGSHPQCYGAGELNTLTDLATATPGRLSNPETSWPACAIDLNTNQFADLGGDYIAQSSVQAPAGILRVVDKQPLNFWHLGLVAMALPKARIIHCTRDIRDCGFSIFSQNFNAQQQWSTDLSDIGHYWQGYRMLMDHWKQVSGLEIIDISYEETIADLEGQARHLLDFLGLSWDERVLNFHENDRAVQTPSRWQVRQPLYQSSKAKWRHYEKHIGPLIDTAGN